METAMLRKGMATADLFTMRGGEGEARGGLLPRLLIKSGRPIKTRIATPTSPSVLDDLL